MADKGCYQYEYPRPMVVTDAVVFTVREGALDVLLIRRGHEPWKGMWALPGGFVELDESLEQACARELAEETSVTGIDLVQFHTFGAVDRDPRGRVITAAYLGVTDWRAHEPAHGDDAAEVAWVRVNELPPLACDHNEIVAQAMESMNRFIKAGSTDWIDESVGLPELVLALQRALC